MADINAVISLGIGSPAGIQEFLTFGLQQGAAVTVPNVVGQSQASGTTTLEGDGFVVAVATAYSSSVAEGLIISQSPAAGAEAGEGSTVTITVSLGVLMAPPRSRQVLMSGARRLAFGGRRIIH